MFLNGQSGSSVTYIKVSFRPLPLGLRKVMLMLDLGQCS